MRVAPVAIRHTLVEVRVTFRPQSRLGPELRQLYGYLVDRRCIVQLTDVNHAYLRIHSHEVLGKIGRDSSDWEAMVPPEVAAAVKQRRLFGYA